MKFKIRNARFKIIFLLTAYSLQLTALCGCEAFRRKFVRKSERKKEVRVVTQTKEYTSEESTEETYKKYYLFWRASHDELVDALDAQDENRKKQIYAAEKIIEHLQQMRELLLIEKQRELDIFIERQRDILEQLDRFRLTRVQVLRIKSTLNKQKRRIQEEFGYRHIQEYLIK